jgi:hypothetical protein
LIVAQIGVSDALTQQIPGGLEPELFASTAGNAQQRPWKYPGLADAPFRFLAQLLPAYLPGPLTQQIFFGAPMPDQLST